MSYNTQSTSGLKIQIIKEDRVRLDQLAKVTGRTISVLATEALQQYLDTQLWQIHAIEAALNEANQKDAEFFDDLTVKKWLDTWGTDHELDSPV